MARVWNIHAAKTHLSRLVDEVMDGEPIILAKAGKPVAKIVALDHEAKKPKPGLWKNKVSISEDFDAPLPQEWVDGFYNRPIVPPVPQTKSKKKKSG